MLRIRLRRVGAKKQPSYRIVVAERTAPRDGKFVESIGFYNPRTDPETVRIEEERALHWLSVGASPSDSVARIFKTHGTLDRFERLKAGESLDTLVAEAEATVAEAEERAEAEAPVEEPAVEAEAPAPEAVTDEADQVSEAGPDLETEVEDVAEVESEGAVEAEAQVAETEETETAEG